MESQYHDTKITSSELANLWMQYINDSLARCIFQHFLYHVEDQNIREVLQYALELSESHLGKIEGFLTKEGYPKPMGFTAQDVTVEAPRLFTDTFMIVYTQIMAIHGLTRYAGAIGNIVKDEQRQYFSQVMIESLELFNKATAVLSTKGIISKPPTFNNQQKVEFIKKQSFITGWFGKRRPINAVEVSGTYLNLQKTMVKIILELAFGQVSQSKEVKKFMERGRQICIKHYEILSLMLKEDNLHLPRTFESEVTDSTIPPFSDKLMLFHVSTLLSSAIGYYGEALALCQRRDLAVSYATMIADIGILAEDGMNLLINKGWMEQPPLATDHEGLSKN
ncbi:DUF3231 family protein [Mesobacillus subterraneus]|uniref:DUF3231 family protein n=1 Tax=Mesobacillus subterraneus TaxID=285983 RepID=A0A3R9EEL6_9BACI|nr:DUF3231 family protein [Mesobacillus subterraneus]RSD28655.1 DUF3231 family protein [Mesobacillus subterraneus]